MLSNVFFVNVFFFEFKTINSRFVSCSDVDVSEWTGHTLGRCLIQVVGASTRDGAVDTKRDARAHAEGE